MKSSEIERSLDNLFGRGGGATLTRQRVAPRAMQVASPHTTKNKDNATKNQGILDLLMTTLSGDVLGGGMFAGSGARSGSILMTS